MSMIFQSPGLLSILSHLQIYPLIDLVSTNRKSRVIENISPIVRIKNPKGLTVRVDISSMEVSSLHSEAVKASINENAKNKYQYYKAYLRQLIPGSEDNYDKIIKKIRTWNQTIQHSIDNPDFNDVIMVDRLIEKNNYVSKNTKRPGLIVKLFRTYYYDKDVFVKTYLYDPNCQSQHYTITENFKNEVIFQCYAEQLHGSIDFISPKLYSWGKIKKYTFEKNGYEFECLFLIMEYIPFVTLKEAVYSTEHMRNIYERVEHIDTELKSRMLHHNDLHSGNIMVSTGEKSPYPEIVILDFGEASLGPTKPLFQTWVSR